MDFTPKQERNGATGATAAHNSVVPGPDATSAIKSAMGSAMAAGSAGPPVVAGEGVVDWETGVGGRDMPGEA